MGTLPRIALGLSAFLVVAAGALMVARPHLQKSFEGVSTSSTNLLDAPRHPVSDDMHEDAKGMTGSKAPTMTLDSTADKPVELGKTYESGPVVVVMTKDGCPCNIEAQTFFNKLAESYEGKATFLGILDGDIPTAKAYRTDFGVPYEILVSMDEKTFHRFGAEQSVYTYLIDKGTIVSVWPGYSRGSLHQLNSALSDLTGVPPAVLDLSIAPEEMTSGCYFFQPVTWMPEQSTD